MRARSPLKENEFYRRELLSRALRVIRLTTFKSARLVTFSLTLGIFFGFFTFYVLYNSHMPNYELLSHLGFFFCFFIFSLLYNSYMPNYE
jgi:hypothetical protein